MGFFNFNLGWGRTCRNCSGSESLQEVHIPVWRQSECKRVYSRYEVTDSMMCIGNKAGGKGTCNVSFSILFL